MTTPPMSPSHPDPDARPAAAGVVKAAAAGQRASAEASASGSEEQAKSTATTAASPTSGSAESASSTAASTDLASTSAAQADATSPTAGGELVVGVQIGRPEVWDAKKHLTGMRKRPVASIGVVDPGPREAGGRSGVSGDHVGDLKHHGGSEQAVYVVAREELDHWGAELGRSIPDGAFGENVTTRGVRVDDAVIGTRWRMGTALLEVTGPRVPCRTFAWAIDEPRWVKRFTDHGRPGAYTRVVEPGTITAGDMVDVVDMPEHGVTVVDVFRAYTGGARAIIERVVAAGVLAPRYQAKLEAKLR